MIATSLNSAPGADRLSLLADLRGQTERLLDSVIPAQGDVAYVEFSISPNIGNHLMWLATMNYLRSRGRKVRYVAHHLNYRGEDLRRAIGRGPILITGGVGASGLWPAIRAIRHQVITENPHNPIVLLPQTVKFRSQQERAESKSVLGSHPHLIVLPRDRVSLEEATASYPSARVELSPDLAFLLPPQRRLRRADHRAVWLAREDVEGAGFKPPENVYRFDWAWMPPSEWRRAYLLMRASGVISRLRGRVGRPAVAGFANPALVGAYERISRLMLGYGNRMADRGEVFVSDRIHGHLLAVLRGQPTVLMPDAFGKNRSIYDEWSSRFPDVYWAETVEAALRLEVLSRAGAIRR
jgi:exopolysaccharide biosynthesis predicted pyruvyltransferase EpsI